MPIIHGIELNIPMDRILVRLQYKKGRTQIDPYTQELLDRMILQAKALCEPAGIWEQFRIIPQKDGTISLNEDFSVKAHKVLDLLKDCTSVYLLACTIGQNLTEQIEKYLHNRQTTEATVLDAIGSEMAEETAEDINRMIKREADRGGYKLTRRYSPGYGDWDLSAQPGILALLQAEQIGLSSGKNFILHPEKSVTALIGVKET